MNDFEKETAKGIVALGTEIAGNLVLPTSKAIGDNIGRLVDGVMDWLGFWGEKQKIKHEIDLCEYKKKIAKKIAAIPEEKVQEPPLRIVGSAIEASKFFIEENELREMFASLIASACNSDMVSSVHPSFIEIVKQMTPLDAQFLEALKNQHTFPAARIQEVHEDKSITPYRYLLFNLKDYSDNFDYNEQLSLTNTIENLKRFGLIKLNRDIIEMNFDYNNFQSHWLYQEIKANIEPGSNIEMERIRIEFTLFGWNFAKCCISKEEGK